MQRYHVVAVVLRQPPAHRARPCYLVVVVRLGVEVRLDEFGRRWVRVSHPLGHLPDRDASVAAQTRVGVAERVELQLRRQYRRACLPVGTGTAGRSTATLWPYDPSG